MRKFYGFLVVVLACLTIQCTAKKQTAGEPDENPLNLDKGDISGVLVVDVETKDTICAFQSDYRLRPASMTKVFTTVAALNELGPEYGFETKVLLSGAQIDGSSFAGDIIIEGGGDPTLGSKYFDETAENLLFQKIYAALIEKGIKKVEGRLLVKTDFFSAPVYPSKRLWEDMGNYYGAPPSSLSFLDNSITVSLSSPDKIGGLCTVKSCQPDVGIEYDCLVRASQSSKDSAYIYGFNGAEKWYISGSIPAGRKSFSIKGAMPNPPLVFGNRLKSFLSQKGIVIHGNVQELAGKSIHKPVEKLLSLESPPLSRIVEVLNKRSINLFADHLLLMLGKNNGNGCWDGGTKALQAFWNEKIGDNTLHFDDGSGLSPFNMVSPGDMVKALYWANSSSIKSVFESSLAVGGVDGTFKSIWRDDTCKGRVIGKSGSMQGVLCYCGYIKTLQNRKFAFCVMVNHFNEPFRGVRKEIEQLVKEIITAN
ncbi:D-alanyl-D-alanine carboxypeptidase/D-alanyl-D-alanine-endopeptidase [Marinilabiliaceae bacterium JC017]|nr:D-alanyl-D-alanine carboxypeptidase/D-alanyl-D-alanine-endopeptidase [Marinilabiliaceae bacterium JC017]